MKIATGTCKYCGQMVTVQVGDDKEYTQEELNKIATAECNCDAAAEARKRADAVQTLRDRIEDLKIADEWIKETILMAIDKLGDLSLQQVKITDGSRVTYTLIATQKNGPKLTVRESCTTMTTVEGTEQTATGAWHE